MNHIQDRVTSRPRVTTCGQNIEAQADNVFVILNAYTGETVASNCPVGSNDWRRLAAAARAWLDR